MDAMITEHDSGCVMSEVNNWHQYRKIKGNMNWTEYGGKSRIVNIK